MLRFVSWVVVGAIAGIVALPVWGAVYGCSEGWQTGRQLPPGMQAAALGALFMTACFWPIAGFLGIVAGTIIGSASCLVRRWELRRR